MPLRKFTSILSVALLAAVSAVSTEQRAEAGFITVATPASSTGEIGARIRWGGTGFEASLIDSNPFGQAPTMNPPGTPFWQVGTAYKFQVSFDGTTGTLGLSIDFDGDNSFGTGESITRNTFGGLITDYTGLGFQYLSIAANGGTSTSLVSDLTINGDSFASLSGGPVTQFYTDSSNLFSSSITIDGKLTFLAQGTAQENPAWNFSFRNSGLAGTPVPEPVTLAAFGLGGLSLLAVRRRLNRR